MSRQTWRPVSRSKRHGLEADWSEECFRSSPDAGTQERILARISRTRGSASGSALRLLTVAKEPLPRLVRPGRVLRLEKDSVPRAGIRDARRQIARFDQTRVHAVHTGPEPPERGVPGGPTPPLPKLRASRRAEHAQRRPVNLGRPRRAPGSPGSDQLLEANRSKRRAPRRSEYGIPIGIAPPRGARYTLVRSGSRITRTSAGSSPAASISKTEKSSPAP